MANKTLPKASKPTAGNDEGDKTDYDKPIKVDKWDGSALKNALDDAAKLVLSNKLGYVESHKLMNGRLLLCTIAVGFALFALLWDYLHPFPQSRSVLVFCVVAYFIMMIILTFYTTYTERGVFMVALQKDTAGIDPDNVCRLASRLKRYDDNYELFMSCTNGITGETYESSFTHSVAKYFDENGVLCEDIFEDEVFQLHKSLTTVKKNQ